MKNSSTYLITLTITDDSTLNGITLYYDGRGGFGNRRNAQAYISRRFAGVVAGNLVKTNQTGGMIPAVAVATW